VIDLGYAFRRAWEITWRRKRLWLFGLLVSLGTVSTRFGTGSSRWEQLSRELPPDVQAIVSDFLSSPWFTVLMAFLVLLGLLIGVGVALLGALGRAALVAQVQADEGHGAVSLRDGWRTGRRCLWPVFLIRLTLGLPAAAVTLAGALPMLAMALYLSGQEQPQVVVPGVLAVEFALFACFLPAVCLAVLLSVPFSLLQRLAVRACVLQGDGVQASIARAWTTLRMHLGALALVWLILLGVAIGVMLVIFLPLALATMALITAALLTVLVSPLLFAALALLIGTLAWLVGAAVNSVVETFTSAVWTLTYRDLVGLGLTGEEQSPGTGAAVASA
jgi:MFS family permease